MTDAEFLRLWEQRQRDLALCEQLRIIPMFLLLWGRFVLRGSA